jgi:hypothetical protein
METADAPPAPGESVDGSKIHPDGGRLRWGGGRRAAPAPARAATTARRPPTADRAAPPPSSPNPPPDLPVDVVANILGRTSVADIAAAARASRAWRAGAAQAWARLAPARWLRGGGGGGGGSAPPAGASPREWAAYAAARHAADAEALRCLRTLASPPDAEAALRRLCALGPAASDALARAADWSDPRCLGLRHWAAVALMEAAAAAAAPRLAVLLEGPRGREPEAMFEAALIIVGLRFGRSRWGGYLFLSAQCCAQQSTSAWGVSRGGRPTRRGRARPLAAAA